VPEQAESAVRRIMASDTYARAVAVLRAEHDRTVADIVRLTEIPAAPFYEAERAGAFLSMAQAHGLGDVALDEVGNVTAMRRGRGEGLICVAAHLDTVFPPGTDVTVRREGTRLLAPGVGDDTRSLAVLLAWVRAMDAAEVRTHADILLVADVGEEGPGDLRGMRHLFQRGEYAGRINAFITVDSPEMGRITTGGVGSKRYRARFRGPGGHSYGAFGLVNPMYAMADAVARLSRIEVPSTPRTTYSASVTGGGTSINSIPDHVWTEFDLRSESADELARLEAQFLALIEAAVATENAVRSTASGPVTVELEKIGDRPAGRTDEGAELPRLAHAAIAAHGGSGGRGHSLQEWIDVEPEASLRGMAAGLTTVLAAAGLS